MRVYLTTFIGALMLIGLATPARTQSLGDLAKKEAERRKNVKDEAKVLTNKDVPRVVQTEPVVSTPVADPADADKTGKTEPSDKAADPDKPADASATDPKDPAEGPKDEAYWRNRQKMVHDQLDRDEQILQAMQTRVNVLTADFVNRDNPVERSVIAVERQKALDEVVRLTAATAADEKAIADFDDEVHRAGVPPGWLR